MSNFFKRILKTVICSIISFFIWFSLSKCFAVTEIDLSYEKETYIDISNYYNTYSAKFRTSYVKPVYMTEAFIDNLFSDLENRLPTITQYSQSQQPYMSIFFDGTSSFKVYFCSNVSISGATLKYKQNNNTFYLQYNYSDNILSYSNINVYNNSSTSDYTLSTLGGRNGDVIQCLLLSNYNKEFYTSQNYPPYASRTMFAQTYIAEKLMQFNPTLEYNNNLLLNIDIITGYDIIYDYDIFYYDSNNEEISVKDYVSYNDTTTWFGNIRAFYIKNSNIVQFPNDTDFYINVVYKPKLSSSNSISDNTMLAFKTLSSITNPDTGGGGDSEGGGGTGGTSVDLSNIENTLGEINTTIIDVGSQTNQNLDYINQSIQDLNNTITSVPDLSQKEEITGDDILENFDFEFSVDPYDNFWNTLLSELQSVLTTNDNRTITLEFRGETYTISVDDFNLDKIPNILKNFLQLFSISVLTYFLLCWVKKSVDLISSGDVSEVLQMNEEEGIVDLF